MNILDYLFYFILAGCILIAPKLLPKAPIFVKMFFYLLALLCISIGCLPFVLFRKRSWKNCLMSSWLCVHFCRIFLGITMEIRGTGNIRRDHGSVLIMNHQSVFDVLALSYLWPIVGNMTAVVTKGIIYLPFFGIGLWKSGFLFIDRKNRSNAVEVLTTESKAINERKSKILIFPEGTRNSKDILLPFKKGAFYMAIQCKCPIQPIIVTHYDWLHKSVNKSKAIINILPEISTQEYQQNNVNDLIELCQIKLQSEYNNINNEIRIKYI